MSAARTRSACGFERERLAARKLLVVQNPNGVECKVANFATTKDTGVVIKIYDHNGDVAETCGPFAVPARESAFCSTSPPNSGEVEDYSCEVTGEGTLARVSFVAHAPNQGVNSGAALEC